MKNKKVFLLLPVILLVIGIIGISIEPIKSGKNPLKNIVTVVNPGSQRPDLVSIGVPYTSIEDIQSIGPYSNTKERFHNGLDFMSKKDLIDVIAIADATVEKIEIFKDVTKANAKPQVNLIFEVNSTWKYIYALEPFTPEYSAAEEQLSLVNVKVGDTVKKGQLIGKLLKKAEGAHTHISIQKDNQDICFSDMFESTIQDNLKNIVMVYGNQPKQLCYF